MQPYLKQHSGLLKTEGVTMLILGVIAILLPVLTTFAITLLLALFLLLSFPSSANLAIGLLVGINLLFTGFWLLMLGGAVANLSESETPA